MARAVLVVSREAAGGRLDRFVAQALGVSRAELQRWIGEGRVLVEGVAREASARLRAGDRILVDPPAPPSTQARPDGQVRFRVVHVDDDLIVVDKPPGLVVHPARGHEEGTLVNGLLALGLFARDLLGREHAEPSAGEEGGHFRPGIVHRLDRGTSGVMVVARSAAVREALSTQFRAHSIDRVYEAIVVGRAATRTFDTLHGRHPRDRKRFTSRTRLGKRAVTHVRALEALYGATRVECTLETGRTHQIRVHLAESGNPVLGDPLYGRPPRDDRVRAVAEGLGHQALHARVLGFVHPRSGARMRFEVAPPADFDEALKRLQR
ncbi:MAG: RluA family pseudouridine synthase [Myxococcales bacterium]|nr:RluA family pseudouridine synthase [Myxococcales bacterium]